MVSLISKEKIPAPPNGSGFNEAGLRHILQKIRPGALTIAGPYL